MKFIDLLTVLGVGWLMVWLLMIVNIQFDLVVDVVDILFHNIILVVMILLMMCVVYLYFKRPTRTFEDSYNDLGDSVKQAMKNDAELLKAYREGYNRWSK